MKRILKILPFLLLFILTGCITQFYPETTESTDILVVEGLITDQYEPYTIKLSNSMPLNSSQNVIPLTGCNVSVSDDLGNLYNFTEITDGKYISDPSLFRGEIGRSYILHIRRNTSSGIENYESKPVEMEPVPPIDSLYYEKVVIHKADAWTQLQEGCQIYLDTQDPTNTCKYYRWEFTETWEFHIPYTVSNSICWVSDNSDMINIKSTSAYSDDKITRFPIDFISNNSDRLGVKYSMLVNQYSLSEDEYHYWEKLQNVTEKVGGLYDIIPASVPSNVYCTDNPAQSVLGYFSVSAKSSRRLFVTGNFSGWQTPYTDNVCVADTVYNNAFIPNLNVDKWIIVVHQLPPPSYVVYTFNKGCADCTVRGTNIKPDFWDDSK